MATFAWKPARLDRLSSTFSTNNLLDRESWCCRRVAGWTKNTTRTASRSCTGRAELKMLRSTVCLILLGALARSDAFSLSLGFMGKAPIALRSIAPQPSVASVTCMPASRPLGNIFGLSMAAKGAQVIFSTGFCLSCMWEYFALSFSIFAIASGRTFTRYKALSSNGSGVQASIWKNLVTMKHHLSD